MFAQINPTKHLNAGTAGALLQCLASPCIEYVYHLTLALCCTMTKHFCVIG